MNRVVSIGKAVLEKGKKYDLFNLQASKNGAGNDYFTD